MTEMKELGTQKNALTNQISQLVNLMDRQNDGLRVKLSRMSPDRMFEAPPVGELGFVNYVSDIAVDIPELKNKFIEKMNDYYDAAYLSDYAKELSRQARLDETSGNRFERLTSLSSFQNRNAPIVRRALQIDLIDDNIRSYLKTKGGKKRRNSKKRSKKRAKKTRRHRR